MNKMKSAHLNEEALMRWQMGDVSESEQTHAAACPECRAQAMPLKDALNWFGAAARQWGEERAALVQEWHAARESKTMRRRHSMVVWAMVSVALLFIFAIGLPRWKAHHDAIEAQIQQRQQEQKQELARDNALLEEVDQDVSQVVPEAMQPLSWNATNSSSVNTTGDTASRQ